MFELEASNSFGKRVTFLFLYYLHFEKLKIIEISFFTVDIYGKNLPKFLKSSSNLKGLRLIPVKKKKNYNIFHASSKIMNYTEIGDEINMKSFKNFLHSSTHRKIIFNTVYSNKKHLFQSLQSFCEKLQELTITNGSSIAFQDYTKLFFLLDKWNKLKTMNIRIKIHEHKIPDLLLNF